MYTRVSSIPPFTSGRYIKLHFDKRAVLFRRVEHFRNVFASGSPRRAAPRRPDEDVHSFVVKKQRQRSRNARFVGKRSIRLAGCRWKEGASLFQRPWRSSSSASAPRSESHSIDRSVLFSRPWGSGLPRPDIPKPSINSWPIPSGTSCASRRRESYMYTENTLASLSPRRSSRSLSRGAALGFSTDFRDGSSVGWHLSALDCVGYLPQIIFKKFFNFPLIVYI